MTAMRFALVLGAFLVLGVALNQAEDTTGTVGSCEIKDTDGHTVDGPAMKSCQECAHQCSTWDHCGSFHWNGHEYAGTHEDENVCNQWQNDNNNNNNNNDDNQNNNNNNNNNNVHNNNNQQQQQQQQYQGHYQNQG